ncbi:unnamed protein product [Gordionus sp. m RMFG-2023]|uniref:transmembrane protein 26-like n=1 Tax=Gordionus sp. m RMFG-2023 TaxID=3053472 RepID=UPI0030E02E6F
MFTQKNNPYKKVSLATDILTTKKEVESGIAHSDNKKFVKNLSGVNLKEYSKFEKNDQDDIRDDVRNSEWNPVHFCDISKAIFVRFIFGLHSFLTIWRVVAVKRNPLYWYMAFLLWPMIVETTVAIIVRKGKEYKWFCPSVFFYLISVLPSIWVLEMDKIDKYIHQNNGTQYKYFSSCKTYDQSRGYIEKPTTDEPLGLNLPIQLTREAWVTTLEHSLIILLILGRWLLPKGELSRDQLSQILLVYLGTAADIMELFETFKEDEVKSNRHICIIILSIWTWSFIQFTFVLTTLKSKKNKLGTIFFLSKLEKTKHQILIDLLGVFSNLMLQDIPFLALRSILIFRYGILSVMIIFFTMKNALVISLEFYRILVLYLSHKKRLSSLKEKVLIHSYFKTHPWSLPIIGQNINSKKADPNIECIENGYMGSGKKKRNEINSSKIKNENTPMINNEVVCNNFKEALEVFKKTQQEEINSNIKESVFDDDSEDLPIKKKIIDKFKIADDLREIKLIQDLNKSIEEEVQNQKEELKTLNNGDG